jgi:hypothetical protein
VKPARAAPDLIGRIFGKRFRTTLAACRTLATVKPGERAISGTT